MLANLNPKPSEQELLMSEDAVKAGESKGEAFQRISAKRE